ncbi:MAG: lipopolysaccharide biosynthesis protein [Bacteroidaceae bacterium]|nr:lipopolysaccharide biosynthesis protein [Bacteroidaceae bacterium]
MLKENTNKAIAINSAILYSKLIICTICGLFTTRYALKALGVDDFGLFSVLGSIISFIAIFNTIMISTSNRFISVAIGKGDNENTNEQFNICLLIHIAISVMTLCIALPVGDFYIDNILQYSGARSEAFLVYLFTVIGSAISFIGVPYNGLLMAKERFWVFSLTDVVSHMLRLAIAYLLVHFFKEKLLIYALAQGILTMMPTLIYHTYCRVRFKEITKFKLCRKKEEYKKVLTFSGWVSYGAFAYVAKGQGAAVIVNTFFNTAMNTALGLANTVGTLLQTVSNSISQPIAPQITKSYVAGNTKRTDELLKMSTKYTYLLMLFISLPFLKETEWILGLWLGNVPEHVSVFTVLIIIDTLIASLNSGISNIIFASGRIKLYQILINTLRLLAIAAAYIVLRMGFPAHTLLYAYITFSVIIFFAAQYTLHATLNYNNIKLWKGSYIPSITITLLLIPFILIDFELPSILNIILIESLYLLLVCSIGLSKKERSFINKLFNKTARRA